MDLAIVILAALAVLISFIGCIVPVMPGPVIGFAGLLCLLATKDFSPSLPMLILMGTLVVIVTIADYVVPAMGAKRFNCTRWGTTGCFVGTVIGMFFFPVGLFLGPFLGAFVGELIAGRSAHRAVQGGIGALLGFLSGVFIKILCCFGLAAGFAWCVFR